MPDNIYASVKTQLAAQEVDDIFGMMRGQTPSVEPEASEPSKSAVTEPEAPEPKSTLVAEPAEPTVTEATLPTEPPAEKEPPSIGPSAVPRETVEALEPKEIEGPRYDALSPSDKEAMQKRLRRLREGGPEMVQRAKQELQQLTRLKKLQEDPEGWITGLEPLAISNIDKLIAEKQQLIRDSQYLQEESDYILTTGLKGNIIPALGVNQLGRMVDSGIGASDLKLLYNAARKAHEKQDPATFNRLVGHIAATKVLDRFRGAMSHDKAFADKDAATDMINRYRASPDYEEAFEAERAHISEYISSKDFRPHDMYAIFAQDAIFDNAKFYNTPFIGQAIMFGGGMYSGGSIISRGLRFIPKPLAHRIAGFINSAMGPVGSTAAGLEFAATEDLRKMLLEDYPDKSALINFMAIAAGIPTGIAAEKATQYVYDQAYRGFNLFWRSPEGIPATLEHWANQALLRPLMDNTQIAFNQGTIGQMVERTTGADAIAFAGLGSLSNVYGTGSTKTVLSAVNPALVHMPSDAATIGKAVNPEVRSAVELATQQVDDVSKITLEDLPGIYNAKVSNDISMGIYGNNTSYMHTPAKDTVELLSTTLAPFHTGVTNAKQPTNIYSQALRNVYADDIKTELTALADGAPIKNLKNIRNSPYAQHMIKEMQAKGINITDNPELLESIAEEVIADQRKALTETLTHVDLQEGRLVYGTEAFDTPTNVDLKAVPSDTRQAILLSQWNKQINLGDSIESAAEALKGLSVSDRLLSVQAASAGVPQKFVDDWMEQAKAIEINAQGEIPVVEAPIPAVTKPTKEEIHSKITAGDDAVRNATPLPSTYARTALAEATAALEYDIYGQAVKIGDTTWYPRFEKRVMWATENFKPELRKIISKARNTAGSTQFDDVELARVIDPEGYFLDHPTLLRQLVDSGVGGITDDQIDGIASTIARHKLEQSAQYIIDNNANFYLAAQRFSDGEGAAAILHQRYIGYAKSELAKYLDDDPTSIIFANPAYKKSIESYLDTAGGRNILEDSTYLNQFASVLLETDARQAAKDMRVIGIQRKIGVDEPQVVINADTDPFSLRLSTPNMQFMAFLADKTARPKMAAPTSRPVFASPAGGFTLEAFQHAAKNALQMPKPPVYNDYDVNKLGPHMFGLFNTSDSVSTKIFQPEAVAFNQYADLPLSARLSANLPTAWRQEGEKATARALNLGPDNIARPLEPFEAVTTDIAMNHVGNMVRQGTAPEHIVKTYNTLQKYKRYPAQGKVEKSDIAHAEDMLSDRAQTVLNRILPHMPGRQSLTLDEAVQATELAYQVALRDADSANAQRLAALRDELIAIENKREATRIAGYTPDSPGGSPLDDIVEDAEPPIASVFSRDPEEIVAPGAVEGIDTEVFDAAQIAAIRETAAPQASTSYLAELSDDAARIFEKYVGASEPSVDEVYGVYKSRVKLKGDNTVEIRNDAGEMVSHKVPDEVYKSFEAFEREIQDFLGAQGTVDTTLETKREAEKTIRDFVSSQLRGEAADHGMLKPSATALQDTPTQTRDLETNIRNWLDATIDNIKPASTVGQDYTPSDEHMTALKTMLKERIGYKWEQVAKEQPNLPVRDRARIVMGDVYNMAENAKTALANWSTVSAKLNLSAQEAAQIEKELGTDGMFSAAAKEAIINAFNKADEATQQLVKAEVDAITQGVSTVSDIGLPHGAVPLGTSTKRSEYATEVYSQQDIREAYKWFQEVMNSPSTEYNRILQAALENRNTDLVKAMSAKDQEMFMTFYNMQEQVLTRASELVGTRLTFEDLYTNPKAQNIFSTAQALMTESQLFRGTQYATVTDTTWASFTDLLNGTNNVNRVAYANHATQLQHQLNANFGAVYDLPTPMELLNPTDYATIKQLTDRAISGYTEALKAADADPSILQQAGNIKLVFDDTIGSYTIDVPDDILTALNNLPGSYKTAYSSDAEDAMQVLANDTYERALDLMTYFTKNAGLTQPTFDKALQERFGPQRINAFLLRPQALGDFNHIAGTLVDTAKAPNKARIDKSMRDMGLLGIDRKHSSISNHTAQGLTEMYEKLLADTVQMAKKADAAARTSAINNPLNMENWNTINASMVDVVIIRRNIAVMQGIKETLSSGAMHPDTFKVIKALEVDPSTLNGMMNTLLRAANNVSPDWVQLKPIKVSDKDIYDFGRTAADTTEPLSNMLKQNQAEARRLMQIDTSFIDVIQDPHNSKNLAKNIDAYMSYIRQSMAETRAELTRRTVLSERGITQPEPAMFRMRDGQAAQNKPIDARK
jgi:hypothetical protein